MQNWGSSFGKGGSRYQPYERTTQQRGGAFNKEGNPDTRNMSFGRGTSSGREYKFSSRGNTDLLESPSRGNTALSDSPSWASRSLGHGFQKRESRQHIVDFIPKRGFTDSLARSEDVDRGVNTYQTSSEGFDRNKSFSRKNQNRDFDVDSYRTSEGRSYKSWLDKEPYESLLNRTKVDIDSYKTVSGGNLGGLGSFNKTDRYQTTESPRMMNKHVLSQGTYNRSPFSTQTRDSPRYTNTQESQINYYSKDINRIYDKSVDKYNGKGSTFGNNTSKSFGFENVDSYSTSSKLTDFRSVLERRSHRAETFSRDDTLNRRDDRINNDDNSWRSNIAHRVDYDTRKNLDENFVDEYEVMGSRSQIRGVNVVGSRAAFNQNQNSAQVRPRSQGRLEGSFTSPSRQDIQAETYFTQESKPDIFLQEDVSRKQIGFDTRRHDVRSMVREESLLKRQIVRQQEREGNKQLLYKARQDFRGMGRRLPKDTEMVEEDGGRHGIKPIKREFKQQRSTRSEEVLRSNRRMMPEQHFEQEHMSGLSAQQRMMEDRIKQAEMRRLGKLQMEQEAARKLLIEKEAQAMALKNQATIAKQQAQEKTILMQATLMRRQRQIAELMKKRQLISHNMRNRAQTRLNNSSLVRTLSQRLKDRARLLETQRRSLELRSHLIRNRNEARIQKKQQPERRLSSEKSDRKKHVSAQSPGKIREHCDVCNIDVRVPIKVHIQSVLHKNKLKKQETLHAKNAEMIYCDACNFKVKGPLEYHSSLKQHENRLNSIKNGCEKCGVSSFADGKELDKHLATEEHKKKVVKKPKTPEVKKSSKLLCNICNVGINDFEVHKQLASHKAREKSVKAGCAICKISSFADGKELDKHRASLKHSELRAKEKKNAEIKKKISDHLMQYKSENDIPAYAPGKTFGVEYVIPSQGYACQLCQKNRKFFLSERSAKVDHCKSEDHYNQWKENELKLIQESEASSTSTKTADTVSKESAVNEKNNQSDNEKKTIKCITEDKVEAKQQVDDDTTGKQTEDEQTTDKTEPHTDVDQEMSNPGSKKESETLTSGEKQDGESFKIVDSVESDTEEKNVNTAGKDTKIEDVKSEELKPTTDESTKPHVSARGQGRGRVQKARRGRKNNKP